MPELPEVETVVRQLQGPLVGRRIKRLDLWDPRLSLESRRPVRGLRVTQVSRLGKQVVLHLQSPRGGPPLWLSVHLRMTGRLLWQTSGPAGVPTPDTVPHLRATVTFDGGHLLFVDVRRFGVVGLWEQLDPLLPAGLDPTSRQFTPKRLGTLLQGSAQEIKVWLLRQDRLCGVGNIYACEALFLAGIDPWRPAGQLTAEEVAGLRTALGRVLRAAIRHCGTTFSDFRGVAQQLGSYQRFLAVYGRQGAPCPRCGSPVERQVQQGRSTFYCRTCQRQRLYSEDKCAR